MDDFVSFSVGGAAQREASEDEDIEVKAPALLTDIPCPWVDESDSNDENIPPFVRFHNEIVNFCDYISPSRAEMIVRKQTFDEFSNICKKLWPECNPTYFGSQVTQFITPSSDLDMAILDVPLGDGDTICALELLAQEIKRKNLVSYIEVIGSSKVPIIKLDHIKSGLSLDICINNSSGEITGNLIRQLSKRFPPLKPLVLIIKVFLSQRKLSETYSGGIGTFVLCNMVVSFLLQRQKLAVYRNSGSTYNLGALLIDFFTLYGSTFNYAHTTCTILSGGKYYPKQLLGAEWFSEQRAISLSIESPDDTLPQPVDIGKNSWMIAKIRRTFEHAMQVLVCGLQASVLQYEQRLASKNFRYKDVSSFLAYIIRPDDAMLMDREPKGLSYAKDNVYDVFVELQLNSTPRASVSISASRDSDDSSSADSESEDATTPVSGAKRARVDHSKGNKLHSKQQKLDNRDNLKLSGQSSKGSEKKKNKRRRSSQQTMNGRA